MCRSKPRYEAQKYLVPILSRRQTLIFLLSGHMYVVATGVENRTPPKIGLGLVAPASSAFRARLDRNQSEMQKNQSSRPSINYGL